MNKWESHKECVLSSGVGVGYQINTERAEVMIFTKEKKKTEWMVDINQHKERRSPALVPSLSCRYVKRDRKRACLPSLTPTHSITTPFPCSLFPPHFPPLVGSRNHYVFVYISPYPFHVTTSLPHPPSLHYYHHIWWNIHFILFLK